MKKEFNGHCGIAHTRWATHGAPCIKNAHPHVDNDNVFVVVHNGIITNYQVTTVPPVDDLGLYSVLLLTGMIGRQRIAVTSVPHSLD